jgi:hypothetical protein
MSEDTAITITDPQEKPQTQYEIRHQKILQYTEDYLMKYGKTPKLTEIAEYCGVHENTIRNHFMTFSVRKDIAPKYRKYIFEVLQRHLALMRQDEDKGVALKACITLEEKLFDLIPKAKIEVQDTQAKKLVIEIEDRRNELNQVVTAEYTIEDTDEDKSST